MHRSPWFWLIATLLVLIAFAAIAPPEKTLGANVRVVYLHGAWVWAALAGFLASGVLGLLGLLTNRTTLHRWSRALGRTGLFFWITYLPISLWAMQTSWNGMFLAEPRFRVAVVFAIGGILLQIGVAIIEDPAWASIANIIYTIALFWTLRNTQNVMHPASPILTSEVARIQFYFFGLVILTLLLAAQVTRFWHKADSIKVRKFVDSQFEDS
jgi:hypothetical protein